jgi:hypothetical protein
VVGGSFPEEAGIEIFIAALKSLRDKQNTKPIKQWLYVWQSGRILKVIIVFIIEAAVHVLCFKIKYTIKLKHCGY